MVTGQLIDLLRDAPAKLAALSSWGMRMENKFAIVEHLNDVVNIESLFASAQDMINQALSGLLSAVRDGIVPMVNNIASMVFTVFLGFVLAFWLACDYPRINEGFVLAFWLACDYPRINEEICRILPEDKADDYRLMVAVLSRSVGGYLRSTLINSMIQGFLAFVGFMIVGHPYAITMGILSGMVAVLSRSVGGYLRSTLINSMIQGFLAFVGFMIVGHPYAITMGILSGILNIIPVVGPSISASSRWSALRSRLSSRRSSPWCTARSWPSGPWSWPCSRKTSPTT